MCTSSHGKAISASSGEAQAAWFEVPSFWLLHRTPQVPRTPPTVDFYPTGCTRVDQRAPSAAGFRAPRCCLHTPAHRMPYSHHHAAPAVRCKSYLISEEEALQKKNEMSCHHHRPPPVGPQRPHPLGRFILHTQTDRRFLAREISFRFVILRPLS